MCDIRVNGITREVNEAIKGRVGVGCFFEGSRAQMFMSKSEHRLGRSPVSPGNLSRGPSLHTRDTAVAS